MNSGVDCTQEFGLSRLLCGEKPNNNPKDMRHFPSGESDPPTSCSRPYAQQRRLLVPARGGSCTDIVLTFHRVAVMADLCPPGRPVFAQGEMDGGSMPVITPRLPVGATILALAHARLG